MSDESGGEEESGWRGDMIAYALEGGHEILVSSSFAQPDVASCSVMITREKPGPVPKEWRKDIVASALLGALRAAANGEPVSYLCTIWIWIICSNSDCVQNSKNC